MPSGSLARATRYNEPAYLQDELDAFSSVGLCRIQFAHTSFTRMKSSRTTDVRERAVLVGLGLKRAPHIPGRASDETARESLEELAELARSAGAVVVGSVLQMRDAIDPASVVGRGKLQEIRAEAQARQAPLIIFDRELTPVQQRNLERGVERRVIDRTQLILDIFARHARSREGQLQVELAQLNYLLPRLAGGGPELSRLGGGIGTRGPGEQKLETDRRRIRERVGRIGAAIEKLRQQRTLRRAARQSVPLGTVALVGYTNAGKSTVFNKIDRLDTDVRKAMSAANGNVYVSALETTGLEELLRRVDEMMAVDPLRRLRFAVPLTEGRKLALVHGLGRVLHSELRDSKMVIDAEVPGSLVRRLRLVP